jgi:hypothetical protein
LEESLADVRDLWHFHFYGPTPLALVKGRERIYFEHFWNDFAADPNHSVPEADRELYAKAYAQPGGMRAGFEYFKNFEQDAKDFSELSTTKLSMPVLVLTGEKASGSFLIEQAKLVATNVDAFLRLSDFINEYDFADYTYPTNDTWHGIHKLLRTDEGYSDLAKRAVLK